MPQECTCSSSTVTSRPSASAWRTECTGTNARPPWPALLAHAGAWLDRLLLVFGVSAIAGIVVAAWGVDHHLRALVWGAVLGFAVAVLALLLWPASARVLVLATALWGLAFGAVPALFQTALARRAGAAADLAQSMLVTGWNLAIAAGGVAGGVLLQAAGAQVLAWLPLGLLLVCGVWLLLRPRAWS